MSGVRKEHQIRELGRAFPASRYDDPRGGRSVALERNILRYRAIETTLYLFYTEEVRDFMLANVYPQAIKNPDAKSWEPEKERRLQRVLSQVLMDAEVTKKVLFEDTRALRRAF